MRGEGSRRVYRKLNLPNKSEMMYRLVLSYDNDDRNTLREMSELISTEQTA